MCDEQSLRSACAYAQSDQSLCLSLEYSMGAKLLTEHNLEFLSLKAGCRGSSESTLVKMPHRWYLMSRLILRITHNGYAQCTLSREQTTKVLIRLRGCAGWCAPLVFDCKKISVSCAEAQILNLFNQIFNRR